ncbi:MAG: tetratricopeptide repeat protein [Bacteroidetes bacterium]|nr:tetratricopeptide repeat protein [Bacteroidota bacterium]
MQLDSAVAVLNSESISNSDNVYIPYLKNYISFVSLFASQDEKLYKELKLLKSENFNKVEKLKDTNPYKKWILGNMHLQWSMLKIMFGDYISAAIEFNSAYHLIDDNISQFPDFRLNDLSRSVLKIIVGLVPEQYNWFLDILSMNGNVEEGKNELSGFLAYAKSNPEYIPYYHEALFYAAFIEMNIHPDKKKITGFIRETESIDDSLLLITFLRLNLYMRTGENQKALELFKDINIYKNKTYPFYYLNYLHAECLLRAQNWDESFLEYEVFTNKFQGQNYIKDAWRKKAWASFMLQDSVFFLDCLNEVKEKGTDRIDLDKEAMAEAENNQYPNRDLLLSRILFDGGYYADALNVLHTIDTAGYTDQEKINYIYRIGRVHHQMSRFEMAKRYYELTISNGKKTDSYYAANAALKLGAIFEAEGQLQKAINAYSECLSMDQGPYRTSINRRAREGLKRVSDQQELFQ